MAHICPSCGFAHDGNTCEQAQGWAAVQKQIADRAQKQQVQAIFKYEAEQEILNIVAKLVGDWDNQELRKKLEDAVKSRRNNSPQFV